METKGSHDSVALAKTLRRSRKLHKEVRIKGYRANATRWELNDHDPTHWLCDSGSVP